MPDDTLFIFSVGGGSLEKNISPNLVRALEYAKQVGASIVGVVGRDGGHTAKVANACVIVPTVNPETITPHAEAFQAVVWHLLVSHPKLKAAPTNQDALDIACYRLLLAIEASLALCYHVAARRFRRAPEDYAGCFGILAEHGLLSADLTARLRRMARCRNLLVHMYWKIDYRRVHEIIQHDLQDLRTFTAAIVAILPPAGESEEPA